MTSRVTVFVPGRVYWPKIVGDKALHTNYDGDGREWSYELVPDDTSFLKEHKLLDRLKDKSDPKNPDKGEFLVLKKPEFNKEGEKNDPIRIVDNTADRDPDKNGEWGDRLIGNGTRVVAKLSIVDWGKGKKKSIYTQALRIEELVSYTSDEFGGYDGEGATASSKAEPTTGKRSAGKTVLQELDDLDDDLPFD